MRADLPGRLLRGTLRLFLLSVLLPVARTEALFLAKRPLAERCRWRQQWCRRVLRALRIPLRVDGRMPSQGMVVSNHLTYLDILTYGAIFDGVLVSKREVRSWPLIGPITEAAGTVYVDRDSVRSAAAASRAVERLLNDGIPVLLFPEGTTSDGSCVLPFQAPLFEAAIRTGVEIWPAAVRYGTDNSREGDPAAIPYWGEMTLAPHLVRVLQICGLSASINVAEGPVSASNRRTAAMASHAAVEALYCDGLGPAARWSSRALPADLARGSGLPTTCRSDSGIVA